ncbi:hypothetical protein ASD54_10970 [Rhizobium sp. Root149]|nr:hypothetical protein ASD54_10970 [Rhizobium sp. Root149]
MPWAKFCCREHKRAADSLARSAKAIDNVVYLTAKDFDRAFTHEKSVSKEDALAVIIDRLFA